MKEKQLTTWEAACIISGYGIGSGVLSMPYLADKCGIILAVIILVAALFASYALHIMIADLTLKSSEGNQIIACLGQFLFRGKLKNVLKITFFVLMAIVLCTNLAAYISGASEVIVGYLGIPDIIAKIIFYAIAAIVVLFGLKAVGVSEKLAVTVIFGLIAVLAIASIIAPHRTIPVGGATLNSTLAFYGMAMFSMAAFFSVPQAVEGLQKDSKKIKKAVFIGLLNTFIIILVITVCALWASTEITEVAMVGWSKGIGVWAEIIGGVFTLLAMLTTYWSLSLALEGIVDEMLHLGEKLSWLIATLPSFLIVLFNVSGFMELMRTAGGVIAIIVACMVIPAFINARREVEGSLLNSKSIVLVEILTFIAYVLMAIGSVVPA